MATGETTRKITCALFVQTVIHSTQHMQALIKVTVEENDSRANESCLQKYIKWIEIKRYDIVSVFAEIAQLVEQPLRKG